MEYDAQQLKEYLILNNHDAIKILESVGCHDCKEYKKEIRCALPNKHNNSAVVVNKNRMSIRIYLPAEEIIRGDIYSLVMYFKKLDFFHAYKYCIETLGFEIHLFYNNKVQEKNNGDEFFEERNNFSIQRYVRKRMRYMDYEGRAIDEKDMKQFVHLPHINFLKDNISIQTQEKYGICYDELSDRIVIPHYKWDTGEILGLFGRTTLPNFEELNIPKYFGLRPFPKGINLYGLYQNYSEIQKQGYVIVLEAEKSVMQLDTMGIKTGVALGCHDITPMQKKILIGLDVEIIIALDKGISLDFIKSIVSSFRKYRKCSYIYDDKNILNDKDSPTDHGIKIFKELFDQRKGF